MRRYHHDKHDTIDLIETCRRSASSTPPYPKRKSATAISIRLGWREEVHLHDWLTDSYRISTLRTVTNSPTSYEEKIERRYLERLPRTISDSPGQLRTRTTRSHPSRIPTYTHTRIQAEDGDWWRILLEYPLRRLTELPRSASRCSSIGL